MSDYTIDLRHLDREWVIRKGLSRYPIYQESHRNALNALILDTYAFREIAHETPEIFVHRLDVTMRTEMPYFNQLYASTDKDYDWLVNVDIATHTDSESVNDGTSHATNESTANSVGSSDQRQFDFPQSAIDPDGDYRTSQGTGATRQDSTGSGTNDSTDRSTGTSESDSATKGISGVSRSALLMEYRNTILNIDQMIVQTLEPLFFQLWTPQAMRTM